MNKEPISVYAINATVLADVTSEGNADYIIRIDYDAATAVDRVQICSDYINPDEVSEFENDVFVKGDDYIAFSFKPLNNSSVYLLTCRCRQPDLNKSDSLQQIRIGMEKTIGIYTKDIDLKNF